MLRRILGNAAALAVGGAVAQVAFFAIEILIARQLLRTDYGVFATVQTLGLTGLIVLDLGMHWYAIEAGSRRSTEIPSLLGTTIVLRVLIFCVLWPAAIAFLSLVGYESPIVEFFAIYFLFSLAMSVQDSLAAAHTAQQRMGINAAFQGSVAIVVALLVAIALYTWGSLESVGYAYVIGGTSVTFVWFVTACRRIRPEIRLNEARQIVSGSYLYALSGLLTQAFRKGDILLLSVFSTMPQVGVYAAASKLLDLAYKVPYLGSLVVSPAMFKSADDDSKFFLAADLLARVNCALGCVVAAFFYHNATPVILLLFGDEFGSSATVLRILSASFALKFIHQALQTILTTRSMHTARTKALAWATGAAALFHAILIPQFGALGAASAVIGAEAILTILLVVALNRTGLARVVGSRVLSAVVILTIAIGLSEFSSLEGLGATIATFASIAVGLHFSRLLTFVEIRDLALKLFALMQRSAK